MKQNESIIIKPNQIKYINNSSKKGTRGTMNKKWQGNLEHYRYRKNRARKRANGTRNGKKVRKCYKPWGQSTIRWAAWEGALGFAIWKKEAAAACAIGKKEAASGCEIVPQGRAEN